MQHQTFTEAEPVTMTAAERLAAEYRNEIAHHSAVLRDCRTPIMRHHHREMRVRAYQWMRRLRKETAQ